MADAIDHKRQVSDRRVKPTSPLSKASLFGRRKHIRRVEDLNNAPYVDLYSLKSAAAVVFTFILSLTDAIFTLKLVSMGGQELNPIMDFFLQFGPLPFLMVKFLLTGTCLLLFLVHKNRKIYGGRISVKSLLVSVLVLYILLICYELILLF